MDKVLKITEELYRAKFFNESEVNEWITEYEKESLTNWRIRHTNRKSKRFICRKSYVCHRSGYKRVKNTKNRRNTEKITGCEAQLHICIKLTTKDTMKKDKYVKEGYPTVIRFKNEHNHAVDSAAAVSVLRPSNDVRAVFESYFNTGMGVKQSMNFHESKLELEFDRDSTEFANARINPHYRTVQFWFDKWRSVNLAPSILEQLTQKTENYAKEGIMLKFRDEPFTIMVVTKIMQRAHQLPFAKDIVFVDSTASCDAAGHSVTFIFTACDLGAVPLAVLITRGQSEADYVAAFELIKLYVPNSFGDQGYPHHFVTDDSDAERNALKQVWPSTTLLLCSFHVLQAVWRWLFEKQHNIHEIDCRTLYNSFKKILTSENVEIANSAFLAATGKNPLKDGYTQVIAKYPQWVAYVEQYWKRREVWCQAFRDPTTYGHQKNIFSEISVRVFKDAVLSGNKALSAIALIDLISTSMDEYYLSTIRNFVGSRNAVPTLFSLKQIKEALYIKKDDIQCIGQNIYKVPSTNGNEFHFVDGSAGVCSCSNGRLGEFCKHQTGIYYHFNEAIPNVPAVTLECFYSMVKLAFDENVQPNSFNMPLVPSSTSKTTKTYNNANAFNEMQDIHDTQMETEDNINKETCTPEELFQKNNTVDDGYLQEVITLIQKHHNNFETPSLAARKCAQTLEKIKTKPSWESLLSKRGVRNRRRCKRLATGRPERLSKKEAKFCSKCCQELTNLT